MYFECHAHPSLKSLLTNGKENCWGYVHSDILSSDLASQSNLEQMKNGNVKITVASLHPIERPFCAPHLLKHVLPIFSPLDGHFLKRIEENKISYYSLLKVELALLESCQNFNGKSFQFVNAFEDISDDKPNLILSVEGGHSFIDTKSEDFDTIGEDLIKNFKEFKTQPHRLLFVTLTHLSQGVLCTHAFGMKMLLMFRDKTFYPKGSGLTTWGKKFIREALTIQNGKRILIDIKHMSIRSRKEYYDLRREEFPEAPIIASHAGIAGCSIYNIPMQSVIFQKRLLQVMKDRERYKIRYYKSPGLFNTFFNPSSINLYDEDIVEIIDSAGLIGISVDKRILGYAGAQTDYFSLEEFNNYYKDFIEKNRLLEIAREVVIHNEEELEKAELEEEAELEMYEVSTDPKNQLRYFCNNVVHVVKVGGEKAWDCICLGSDFDGLIDSIDPVPTIEHYSVIETALTELLPAFLLEANIPIPDIHKVVKKIMYENGYEFVRKNFK